MVGEPGSTVGEVEFARETCLNLGRNWSNTFFRLQVKSDSALLGL